jgi:uncharacterized lipoprotein YbaY
MLRPVSLKTIATAAITLALVGMLAACGDDENPTVTVSGDLQLAEQASIPAGSTARVSVFEHRDGGGDKRIVAERTLHELGKKPIAFELEIARNLINPQGEYGLRGEVTTGEGEVVLHSPEPIRFKPLTQEDAMRIRLEPVAQPTQLTFKKYRCEDGFHLSAATNDDEAVVRLGNRRLVLAAEDDGQSYADEHDNRLATTENGIDFRVDDAEHQSCEVVTDQSPPLQANTQEEEQTASSESAQGADETAQQAADAPPAEGADKPAKAKDQAQPES